MPYEFNRLPEVSGTVPATANTVNVTLTAPTVFITADTETVVNVTPVNNLVADLNAILSIGDGTTIAPLVDKRGYNIRADRIVQRAKRMPGGIANNATVSLRVATATDPTRVVVLTPLPRSTANVAATTANTGTGTGINVG